MEFITVRDLRLRPGEVWRKLREVGELVLTSNGRPVAVISGVQEGELEQTLSALRRARAQVAVSRLRRLAQERGWQNLSAEEIEAEIAQARRERSASSDEAAGACSSS